MRILKSALIALLAVTALGAAAHDRDTRRAVTMWWVIFNNPDACTANPGGTEQCGGVDVFGEAFLDSIASGVPNPALISPNVDAGLAVIHGTGAITNRKGRVRMVASIYRSSEPLDMTGAQTIDPMGLGTAYTDTGAEVHLVVRDHGKVVRSGRIDQITNFLEPYCSDPILLADGGENICQDVQFAVFAPGETGKDSMIRFADQGMESGAFAYLVRQGDVMQAVVETRVH